jgi:hypothetical protein
MCASLIDVRNDEPARKCPQDALGGTCVSSLHRLKDIDNRDGGFFIFADMLARVEGMFRLKFSLYEIRGAQGGSLGVPETGMEVIFRKGITSKPFPGQSNLVIFFFPLEINSFSQYSLESTFKD